MTDNFFNLDSPEGGIQRMLADGVNTSIFVGDQAMLSVVTLDPNSEGSIHSHPQEQWGVCLEGSGVRIQEGAETAFKKGDFWRTPGDVVHGVRIGPDGATILDIFAPPRDEYRKAGSGFGA
jgi:quercetin dioxygenase-like cupin family protein